MPTIFTLTAVFTGDHEPDHFVFDLPSPEDYAPLLTVHRTREGAQRAAQAHYDQRCADDSEPTGELTWLGPNPVDTRLHQYGFCSGGQGVVYHLSACTLVD